MLDSYVAIVLYGARPSITAPGLETAVQALEPGVPVSVEAGAADDSLLLKIGDDLLTVTSHPGPMPEEAAVTSLGMADLNEEDLQRLRVHGAHVMIAVSDEALSSPMDRMINLLKTGMALCVDGGWALCVPGSGICLQADQLKTLANLNQHGPRVWGVDDETEIDLPGYEKHTLWDSLRREAQPAGVLVGFVPAEVEGRSWFFSAGHSLFGMPEIAYAEGNLDDYKTVRELFRFIFPFMYQQPHAIEAGKVIQTNDPALSISLEKLPPKYEELESPTGTLRVRLITKGPFSDWDSI